MTEANNPSEAGRFRGIVRPLVEKDLPQIRPILETWLRNRKTNELEAKEVEDDLALMRGSSKGENDRAYLVAEQPGGQIIGVIGMTPPDEVMRRFTITDNPVELVNAYVAKEHRRGHGVGSALVARLEDEARRRGHTEIIFNSGPRYKDTAWGFYDQLPGYQRAGIAERMYGEGGNAPVWRKVLDYSSLNLLKRLESESNYFERLKVLATVRTSIGGKMEGQLKGHEAGKWWETINPILERLIEDYPDEAVKFGVWLTTLPKVSNAPHEWENRWHRGNGLVLLGDPRLSDRFVDALNKNEKLRVAVSGFMDFDPTLVQTLEDTSKHPEAFNLVTDLKLVLGLKSMNISPEVNALIKKAKDRVRNDEVVRLIGLFGEITDTQELYQFFRRGGYIS